MRSMLLTVIGGYALIVVMLIGNAARLALVIRRLREDPKAEMRDPLAEPGVPASALGKRYMTFR